MQAIVAEIVSIFWPFLILFLCSLWATQRKKVSLRKIILFSQPSSQCLRADKNLQEARKRQQKLYEQAVDSAQQKSSAKLKTAPGYMRRFVAESNPLDSCVTQQRFRPTGFVRRG